MASSYLALCAVMCKGGLVATLFPRLEEGRWGRGDERAALLESTRYTRTAEGAILSCSGIVIKQEDFRTRALNKRCMCENQARQGL